MTQEHAMQEEKTITVLPTPKRSYLSIADRRELNLDFLSGMPKKEIARKYGIATNSVNSFVKQGIGTHTELEKTILAVQVARENEKIAIVKDKALDFFAQAIDEAQGIDNKAYYFSKFKDMFGVLDNTLRLNNQQATEITENKNVNVNVDVAKTLSELKTTEDKKKFLLDQLHVK